MIVYKTKPHGALQLTREGTVYRMTIASIGSSIALTPREISDLATAVMIDVIEEPELMRLANMES